MFVYSLVQLSIYFCGCCW